MTASYPLLTLRIGKVQPLGDDGRMSAIAKAAVDQPLWLAETGFRGDEQADLRHHGGLEKAVHHYAFDHYAAWSNELPQAASLLLAPGVFGENLATVGLTEDEACIGDRYQLGEAVLELSQPRQPCWKLNVRLGVADVAKRVQASARTGWYYRVIQPGWVRPDDALQRTHRPHADWSVRRVLDVLHRRTLAEEDLLALSRLPALTPKLRQTVEQRLATRQVEDWSRRLNGE